jgi:hypothetical protein
VIEVGGVYSVVRGCGDFGLVKVLAFEPDADIVYARTYDARFKARSKLPLTVQQREPSHMLMELRISIGVLPVTQRVFDYWQPELLFLQEITDEERQNLEECLGYAEPWDDLWHP